MSNALITVGAAVAAAYAATQLGGGGGSGGGKKTGGKAAGQGGIATYQLNPSAGVASEPGPTTDHNVANEQTSDPDDAPTPDKSNRSEPTADTSSNIGPTGMQPDKRIAKQNTRISSGGMDTRAERAYDQTDMKTRSKRRREFAGVTRSSSSNSTSSKSQSRSQKRHTSGTTRKSGEKQATEISLPPSVTSDKMESNDENTTLKERSKRRRLFAGVTR